MATASNIGEQLADFAEGVGTAMRNLKTEFTGDIDGGLISGSDSPSQTMSITENGTYNVTGKTTVNVNANPAYKITLVPMDTTLQYFQGTTNTRNILPSESGSDATNQQYTTSYPTWNFRLLPSANRVELGTIVIDGVDTGENYISNYVLSKDITISYTNATQESFTPLTISQASTMVVNNVEVSNDTTIKNYDKIGYKFIVTNPNNYSVKYEIRMTNNSISSYISSSGSISANTTQTISMGYFFNENDADGTLQTTINFMQDSDGNDSTGDNTPTVLSISTPTEVTYYTLTINYVYLDGGTTAASQYTGQYKYGQSYSVPSPQITGFIPDQQVVSGTISSHNNPSPVTVGYTAEPTGPAPEPAPEPEP